MTVKRDDVVAGLDVRNFGTADEHPRDAFVTSHGWIPLGDATRGAEVVRQFGADTDCTGERLDQQFIWTRFCEIDGGPGKLLGTNKE
ncbi:MAG TPA: hypothetical protein VF201_12535 [Nitrolancea sp.]